MARSTGTLREWLGEGPFSLALSSSWLGLFCHAGVVCALVESGLAPAKICGSSGIPQQQQRTHYLTYVLRDCSSTSTSPAEMSRACVSESLRVQAGEQVSSLRATK